MTAHLFLLWFLSIIPAGSDPILLPPISNDPLAPRTLVWPVLHTGDPAPDMPGATITYVFKPLIDGAGNVLIYAYFLPAGQPLSRRGLWFGQPGALQVIAYDGMQAHGMPPGVTYDHIIGGSYVSENGWIALVSTLAGPGIVSGVNDYANFAGPPGDIRKVLQGGDAPPDVEPGVVVDASDLSGLTPWLSDNATMLVIAWLRGPGIDDTNDKGIWIGPRDDLRLIWRRGMEAPGTDGGRFDSADFVKFNDAGQVAFRGELIHEGDIGTTNDGGQWSGGVDSLLLVAREGDPAPLLPNGVLFASQGNPPAFNSLGDFALHGVLEGDGVTPETQVAYWVGRPDPSTLVYRTGNQLDHIGVGIVVEAIETAQLSAAGTSLQLIKLSGPGVDPTNAWMMVGGSLAEPQPQLRDGDVAPSMTPGVYLSRVVAATSTFAMNDHGDAIAPTELSGEGVNSHNKVLLWSFDGLTSRWHPLLRSNTEIGDRVVSIPLATGLTSAYAPRTGGSDGMPQSFNDACQIAIKLTFTDGTHGAFRLGFLWPGDGDANHDVDFADFSVLQRCWADGAPGLPSQCAVFDFDFDNDLDMFDLEAYFGAVAETH